MVTFWLCQQFAIENGPVEIVDFPICHSFLYVYQRVMVLFLMCWFEKNMIENWFVDNFLNSF